MVGAEDGRFRPGGGGASDARAQGRGGPASGKVRGAAHRIEGAANTTLAVGRGSVLEVAASRDLPGAAGSGPREAAAGPEVAAEVERGSGGDGAAPHGREKGASAGQA